MSTQLRSPETRKQREIRQRESQILDVARRHLLASGYLGLKMECIAEEIEYSKGTIYQHFRNKEEILLALANEALDTRLRMFRRAADLGDPVLGDRDRVRLASIGAAAEAFVEHLPHFFMVEQILRASSIWEKTSPERRDLMQECERHCMGLVVEVVRRGVERGDLTLADGVRPEEVVFGMWSIHLGAQTIHRTSHALAEIGIPNPIDSLRRNQFAMLDGHNWRPLSGEYDYAAHMDRVRGEHFRKEDCV